MWGISPVWKLVFLNFFQYDDSFPIQYVITSKTGRDIRKFNSQEKEILFERDSMFYISKVVNNVIYMEEI